MASYHDDNFGEWHDMEEPENRAFYQRVQATNVLKQCSVCGHWFHLQPQYDKCNGCCEIMERGGDAPEFVDHPKPEESSHDPMDDAEFTPTPIDPCAVCGNKGEECTCDGGSTDDNGRQNFCYDCNCHVKDCTCGYESPDNYFFEY